MIKINIYQEENFINKVIINGHANSDEYGKDLVCAGVSSIVTGTINAINELKGKVDYDINEGFSEINFAKDNESQTIAKTMIIQLKTIEESNKKNVKIIYSYKKNINN